MLVPCFIFFSRNAFTNCYFIDTFTNGCAYEINKLLILDLSTIYYMFCFKYPHTYKQVVKLK